MQIKKCSFLSEGQKIAAALLFPDKIEGKLPGVVFYHGAGSNKGKYIERARPVVDAGIIALIFDFRGCGESEGKLSDQTVSMALTDALTAVDFLVSHPGINPERLGIAGRSFGAYLAALVCGQRSIKSMVFSIPAIYEDRHSDYVYKNVLGGERGFFEKINPEGTQALKAISSFEGSLLVIESEKDEVIPRRIPKAYFDHAKKTREKDYVVVKNGTHRMDSPEEEKLFQETIKDWFLKTL